MYWKASSTYADETATGFDVTNILKNFFLVAAIYAAAAIVHLTLSVSLRFYLHFYTYSDIDYAMINNWSNVAITIYDNNNNSGTTITVSTAYNNNDTNTKILY